MARPIDKSERAGVTLEEELQSLTDANELLRAKLENSETENISLKDQLEAAQMTLQALGKDALPQEVRDMVESNLALGFDEHDAIALATRRFALEHNEKTAKKTNERTQ